MRTRFIIAGIALVAAACTRDPLFPGTPRSSHEPDAGRQRADTSATAPPGEHVYLTAVRFPDGYAWDLDTCAVDGDVWIDLYRDGERVRSIPASGSVTVDIECSVPGTEGNTTEGTIIFSSSGITGVTGVTNAEAITGGTDQETDAALIARIQEYDQTQSDSFVGNAADYRRWAMTVEGIGSASVISASDNSGTVTIVLTDSTGAPASDTLCEAVYDYIMSPDDPYSRLAPINAVLSVIAPTTIEIAVKATVELTAEAVLADVTNAFLAGLEAYMPEALSDAEVKITRVAAILSATDGVNDFSGLQIGDVSNGTPTYGTGNITISATQLPTITASNIDLTEGTV